MPATNFSSLATNGDSPAIFTGSSRLTGSASGTGNPVMGDPVQCSALISFQATAAANTDQSVQLPYGARILAVTILENVVPTGATTSFTIGSTQGGADIVSGSSVAGTQTVATMALNGARQLTAANFASIVASQAGGSTIWIRDAQTTPTAVGQFTIFIEYVMA